MPAKKRPATRKRTPRPKSPTALSVPPVTRGEVLDPTDHFDMPPHVKRALFEVGTWYVGWLAKLLFKMKSGMDREEAIDPKKL